MNRNTDQILEIGTVLVLILTAFCFMYYLIIAFNPMVILNPFPPPLTATPTFAPTATFPATWTPTVTGTPTDTPLPSGTPTVTATPTGIPTMTPTPTITPTITPTPTETDTPAPTDMPTLIPSPTPWPYEAMGRVRLVPDCEWMGVEGRVRDPSGYGVPGVVVKIWADGYSGSLSKPSDGTGFYSVMLDDHPKAGKWYAGVWENGVVASPVVTVETDTNCQSGAQRIYIDWTAYY